MSRLATPLSVLAIAGSSIALVACGSSGDGSSAGSASSTTNGGGTQNAAFEKYRQCLKDNGVTLPDRGQRPDGADGGPGAGGGYGPPPGATGTNGTPPAGGGGFPGGGAPDAKTQKAMQACAKLRPQGQFRGGYGNGGGQRPQQDIKAFTPYLTCLKSEGLDIKVSDGFNALRNLKQSDPKVQAAFKTCSSKLPQRPSGNGQQPTTTSGSST
jgi:hypothetical protein